MAWLKVSFPSPPAGVVRSVGAEVVLTASRLRVAFADRPGLLDLAVAPFGNCLPPDLLAALGLAGRVVRFFLVSGFLAAFFIWRLTPRQYVRQYSRLSSAG